MTCAVNETLTDFGCIPNDPAGFASKFYGIALGMIGGLGLIFLIIGGYQILTSGGNQEKLASGKRTIMYTLGAVALMVGAGVVLQLTLVDVLNVPGVGK